MVYIARAVDERDPQEVASAIDKFALVLSDAGLELVDPVAASRAVDSLLRPDARVEADLAILRASDALLVDMSLPDWPYVGCICELVYAHLWGIPSVVVVGQSRIGERIWLRYHARAIVVSPEEAAVWLRELLLPD